MIGKRFVNWVVILLLIGGLALAFSEFDLPPVTVGMGLSRGYHPLQESNFIQRINLQLPVFVSGSVELRVIPPLNAGLLRNAQYMEERLSYFLGNDEQEALHEATHLTWNREEARFSDQNPNSVQQHLSQSWTLFLQVPKHQWVSPGLYQDKIQIQVFRTGGTELSDQVGLLELPVKLLVRPVFQMDDFGEQRSIPVIELWRGVPVDVNLRTNTQLTMFAEMYLSSSSQNPPELAVLTREETSILFPDRQKAILRANHSQQVSLFMKWRSAAGMLSDEQPVNAVLYLNLAPME